MPVMVPIILPSPRLISMKKNMTDQKGDAGKWVMASVKAMKARPVPWTACREMDTKAKSGQRQNRQGFVSSRRGTKISHLVEFVLQETRLQTQLSKAVFFDCLDDAVHLGII